MFLLHERVIDNSTGELATVTYSSTDWWDAWYDNDVTPSQMWPHATSRFTKITEIETAKELYLVIRI